MRTHLINLLLVAIFISTMFYGCTTQYDEPTSRSPEPPVPQATSTTEPPIKQATPSSELQSETVSSKTIPRDKQAKPEGEPRIKVSIKIDRLDVMGIIGQSGSQMETWNLSYAEGTYSQNLQDTQVTGEIIDLGGVKLVNGKEYPFLMAEGKVFVWQCESSKQTVEKTTNERGFTVLHEEKVWSSTDGNVTIIKLEGVFGLVLDPEGFPRDLKVIGLSDSKFMYLYPSK